MGLRFRKSINLGGARINISKKGVGASIGGKGARITKTADGKTRSTLSVPGTGLSYSTESSKKKTNKKQNSETSNTITPQQDATLHKAFSAFFKVFGIIIIILSLLLWIVLLPVGIAFTIFGVFLLFVSRHYKNKLKSKDIEDQK